MVDKGFTEKRVRGDIYDPSFLLRARGLDRQSCGQIRPAWLLDR
jgi:hypothetical protein